MAKDLIIGYTCGVFDLFHIGHLNILREAKGLCDKLIVGVSTDKLVNYKNKKPVIPFEERIEIIRNINYVDLAVPQENMDKVSACKKLKVNYLFVGDDWYNSDSWKKYEEELLKIGVKVIYLPYTKHTSSTLLTATLKKLEED